MVSSQVDTRPIVQLGQTVIKHYPEGAMDRWEREVRAYTQFPRFTPKLLDYGEGWLEVERLTPITHLPPSESVIFRLSLRGLLQELHQAGLWHCDVSLVNVVVDWSRGPLLIDWENARPSRGRYSYDLYGARKAGVEVEYAPHGPDGVRWGAKGGSCPKVYWEGL